MIEAQSTQPFLKEVRLDFVVFVDLLHKQQCLAFGNLPVELKCMKSLAKPSYEFCELIRNKDQERLYSGYTTWKKISWI